MTAGVPVYSCGRMARSEYQVMHIGQTMSRTTTTTKSIACNSRGATWKDWNCEEEKVFTCEKMPQGFFVFCTKDAFYISIIN